VKARSRWLLSAWVAIAGTVLVHASPARAALTDSEKAQVRSYVATADLGMVPRVRALVARPDLSDSEVGETLSAALRSAPFDDARERFVHALVFGPASLPSRSTIAPGVVRGLVARADAIMAGQRGSANQWSTDALDELLRIHRYVARMSAQARDAERQGMASLETRAIDAIAAAYRDHIARHPSFFSFRSRAHGAALLLRLQVARTAVQTTSGAGSRDDVADWLGLRGPARGLFIRSGVLLDDGGEAPEDRVASIVNLLEAVPGALEGVSEVVVSKTLTAPSNQGPDLVAVRVPLGAGLSRRAGLWPDAASQVDPDQATFEAAYVTSLRAARRAIARDVALAAQVRDAMAHAAGKGAIGHLANWVVDCSLDRDAGSSVRPVSPEMYLAATMTMVLLDAQRTVDLASMRLLSGRPEPVEQLLLGLRVLATAGQDGSATLPTGSLASGQLVLRTAAMKMRGSEIQSLRLAEREVTFDRGADGHVASIRFDGRPVRAVDLTTVRVPTTAGDRWEAGGRTFVRLNGSPRVGVLGADEFVLESGGGETAPDGAIYTQAPSADQTVEATVQLQGKGLGGQIVRASTGQGSFCGVAVMLRCDGGCHARLASFDGAGHERELAPEVKVADAQASEGVLVRLSIRGQDVTAKVAGRQLRGRLAEPMPPGHVGWTVKPGSRLVVRGWTIGSSK